MQVTQKTNRQTPQKETAIDPVTVALGSDLMNLLSQCDREAPNKKQVVSTYMQGCDVLAKQHEELQQFLVAVRDANIHVYVDRGEDGRPLLTEARNRVSFPAWNFAPEDILNVDVVAKPAPAMATFLTEALHKRCREMTHGFFDLLNELVDTNKLGVISWHPDAPDVCEYNFYRLIASHKNIETRYSRNVERREYRERNRFELWDIKKRRDLHQETLAYESHTHHVYDAQVSAWPARKIPKPKFIATLLAAVPPILRKHVLAVSGEMCRETIKVSTLSDRTFAVEKEVFAECIAEGTLMSPAITISNIVLSGWSDRDL